MKKIIAAVLLAVVSSSVLAEKWSMIDESKESDLRVLVDSDSWKVTEDKGTSYIYATYRFVKEGVPGKDLTYLTGLDSCKNRNGTLYQRANIDGKWTTVNQYWWSKQGTKLFDSIGGALCDILEVRIKELEREKTPTSSKNST